MNFTVSTDHREKVFKMQKEIGQISRLSSEIKKKAGEPGDYSDTIVFKALETVPNNPEKSGDQLRIRD